MGNQPLSSSHVPAYSLFAQLLASERLRVTVDRHARTASFAPESRLLTLPSWSNFDNDAWLLFIAHEVGHALYTPADSLTCPAFEALTKQYGRRAVLTVANIFEDVRIERLVRDKYRGLAGTFSRGYHSLMHRKFFGFDTLSPDDWSSKMVLDRINVYAKVGGLLRLSLTTAQEIAWFNRALRANTFDEIMVLVADVMAELSEEQRQQAAQQSQPSQGQMSGQSQNEPSQGQLPRDGQDKPSSQDKPSQGEPSQGKSSQDKPSQGESSQDAQGEPSQGEPSQDAQGQPSQDAQGEPSSQPASSSSSTTEPSNPFAVPSQEAAESILAAAADVTYYDASNVTVMLPVSTQHLHHNDRTIEEMLSLWKATPEQRDFFCKTAQQQRRDQSSILASMIAAFRANQSAWQSRRVQVSRSGVIDTAKLAQYKLTEDLFLRRRSLPEAQNHGFVLHVDWSGSMDAKMAVVLWQVLHLIWFAESIKVPVSVYGFSNSGNDTPAAIEYASKCRQNYSRAGRGRLIELYRSNAPSSVKQDAQSFLFALVLRFSGLVALSAWELTEALTMLKAGGDVEIAHATRLASMPKSLLSIVPSILSVMHAWGLNGNRDAFGHSEVNLGGTPLHHALISSVDTVRKFRQVHRVEQCVSVWLTDGEDTDGAPLGEDMSFPSSDSADSSHRAYQVPLELPTTGMLVDPRSGRSFAIHAGRGLATLFEMHRALTGATVICVDITSAPMRSYSRVLSRDAQQIVVNNIGEPEFYGRRRRGVLRPKPIKQTRKRVVIATSTGTFDETGLMMVTRAEYPEIGCDAYLVTHPDWWSSRNNTTSHNKHVQSASSVLSSTEDDDLLTPEERAAEAQNRPVRLAAALREGAAHIAMRRFADLLVPYMAAGRADGTV